jgi:large subunit ribosomal protein L15
MRLHTLKPAPGSTKRKKRVGRGESSGHGKTSGRGHKGQKARSGSAIRPGFEGGQMPLYRRLPKKGFNNNAFKTIYAVYNLDRLADHFDDGATINEASLREKNILKGRWRHKWDGIKILGEGEVAKKWTVEVDKISTMARQKIEAAGGSVTLIFRTLKDAADAKAAVETAAKSAAYAAKTKAE